MFYLQNEPFSIIPVAILTVALTVMFFMITYFKRKNNKTIPLAPVGMIEAIQNFCGPNAPWFVLNMAQCTKSDIFRFNLQVAGELYCVGCPVSTREILLDDKTDKPGELYQALSKVFGGDNIVSRSNTPQWSHVRKGMARAFSSIEINRMKCVCSKHVDRWIKETLGPCIENNESFDPSKEMCRITFRIILEAGFEYDVSDDEYEHFIHHIEISIKEFVSKQTSNIFRKYYAPFLSEYRNALKSCIETQAFARKVLNTYRKNQNKSDNNTIIRTIIENDSLASDVERAAEICAIIFAGHDTTGFTLAATLILLSKHPEISHKLRRELLSLDVIERSQSKYLRNVITETQRLFPSTAFGSVRVIGRDIKCKGGSMIIPKGSICSFPQVVLQRNENIFKNADTFKPERWETANEEMRGSFLPFALGNRNCVGQSLAISELYTVLPKLLANYNFEIETEGKIDFFMTFKHDGTRLKPSRVQ